MKKKVSKGKKQTSSSQYHRGPLFGSREFKVAYDDPRWEKGGRGICGPTAVAVAKGVRTGAGFAKILNDWKGGFAGSASVKDMERQLTLRGLTPRRKRVTKRSSRLELPEGVRSALVSIQWGTAKHWLFLERVDGTLRGACSEYGWFNQDDRVFKGYLKPTSDNWMRSYLVLEDA